MKKSISRKNLPIKLPVSQTVLYTFLMYYFNADRLWWGIFIALAVIIWVALLAALIAEKDVDIFSESEIKKSTFADKLRDIVKENKSSKS